MSQRLTISFVFSGIAHIFVLGLLMLNVAFDSVDVTEQPAAPNIQARAVDGEAVKKEIQRRENETRQEKRRIQQEKDKRWRAIVEERNRKKREEQARQDQLRQEKLRQEKLADEQKRKKEQQKREQELAEELAKQRELEEQQLAEQLAAEQQALAAQRQAIMSEVDIYRTRIQNRIRQYWNEPERDGLCDFNIRLGPGGILLQFTRLRDEGRYCDSAERAVNKAAPLPMSDNPKVLDELRNLNIQLKPKER